MKTHILILAVVMLGLYVGGCSPDNTWLARQEPETAQERQAVAALETKILSHIPQTLAGHDQDWDDAIYAAHNVATKTVCKERLYEYEWSFLHNWTRTGRVRDATNWAEE